MKWQSEVSVNCIPVNTAKKLILYSGWNHDSCNRLINDMITALMEKTKEDSTYGLIWGNSPVCACMHLWKAWNSSGKPTQGFQLELKIS